jgi:hypothetical protein
VIEERSSYGDPLSNSLLPISDLREWLVLIVVKPQRCRLKAPRCAEGVGLNLFPLCRSTPLSDIMVLG